MRAFLIALLVTGCYRDTPSAKPVVANGSDPALHAHDPTCEHDDDAEHGFNDLIPDGRLRTELVGPLAGRTGRTWEGGIVPDYIPMKHGTLELFVLDHPGDVYFAMYREPYDLGSCPLGATTNCAYRIEAYENGELAWSRSLNTYMSRPDGLEVQDIRFAKGIVYFNEACQSYSAEQGGKCSSLVAVDPAANRVLWRSPPLVSNNRFVVRGCYLVTGYGFTAEPDNLFLVDRANGKVVQKVPVSSAPQVYWLNRDLLTVTLYSGIKRQYKLDGIETHAGRIVELSSPERMYGGAGYGGASYGGSYGGATYGRSYGGAVYGGATTGGYRGTTHPTTGGYHGTTHPTTGGYGGATYGTFPGP